VLQTSNMHGKILVVYYHYRGYPLRMTTKDMFNSFERYSNSLCYYVNIAFGFPEYLKNVNFDLIIFMDMFLSKRILKKLFNKAIKACQPLKNIRGKKIAIPQDEFYFTNDLNQFINEFKIKYIFSVSPESEWLKIYPNINRSRVKIEKVLTGYLEDETLQAINRLNQEVIPRHIDIGYRSTPLRYSLGRHGYMKGRIAEVFIEESRKFNLKIDISTQPIDTKLGLDWYNFLLECKYFIGIESGASLLDPDGAIYHRVNTFINGNPLASFNETEQNCFKGLDGNLKLYTLGPRHLEACATKTCQILIEGDYDGILQPYKHYLPIKKDFSNINEILQIVKEDKLREKIVNRAYRDIVASRKWTYQEFVKQVFNKCGFSENSCKNITDYDLVLYKKNFEREKRIWSFIPYQSSLIDFIERNFPRKLMAKIIKFIQTS
jgi:hypothetical protein